MKMAGSFDGTVWRRAMTTATKCKIVLNVVANNDTLSLSLFMNLRVHYYKVCTLSFTRFNLMLRLLLLLVCHRKSKHSVQCCDGSSEYIILYRSCYNTTSAKSVFQFYDFIITGRGMRHASQTNHTHTLTHHPLAVRNVIAILWGYWLECYDSIASSLLIACPRFYEFISITLCPHSRHFPVSDDDTYFSCYMWNRGCIVHKQRYLCRCQPNTIASACETICVSNTNIYIYIIHWNSTTAPFPCDVLSFFFREKRTDCML